jgi:hypothetical protein
MDVCRGIGLRRLRIVVRLANLRRAENLRLQTIYRIGRNILLFTINYDFSIFVWSNYLLAKEGSQIGCRSHKRKTHAKTCPQRAALAIRYTECAA